MFNDAKSQEDKKNCVCVCVCGEGGITHFILKIEVTFLLLKFFLSFSFLIIVTLSLIWNPTQINLHCKFCILFPFLFPFFKRLLGACRWISSGVITTLQWLNDELLSLAVTVTWYWVCQSVERVGVTWYLMWIISYRYYIQYYSDIIEKCRAETILK